MTTRTHGQRNTAALLGLVLGIFAASCSSDGGASFALDDLRTTGENCPVDVTTALSETRLGPGEVNEVEIADGSRSDVDETPLDRANGVLVECTASVDDATISVQLLASEEPAAGNLLAPMMMRDLDLDSDALGELLDELHSADAGELVELPGDAPVAMANVGVDDAESAVVYVRAEEATRDDVDAATTAILDEMSS